MEYLLRISLSCAALRAKDKAVLARSAAYARLSAFIQRMKDLQVWLSERCQAAMSFDEAEVGSGDLAEELGAICRSTLGLLPAQAWASLGDPASEVPLSPSSMSPWPSQRQHQHAHELTQHLPLEFVQSSVGRRVIEGLPSLCTADLENILQGSKCVERFRMLSELLTSTDYFASLQAVRPGCLPFYSPLGELEEIRGDPRLSWSWASARDAGVSSLPVLPRPGTSEGDTLELSMASMSHRSSGRSSPSNRRLDAAKPASTLVSKAHHVLHKPSGGLDPVSRHRLLSAARPDTKLAAQIGMDSRAGRPTSQQAERRPRRKLGHGIRSHSRADIQIYDV